MNEDTPKVVATERKLLELLIECTIEAIVAPDASRKQAKWRPTRHKLGAHGAKNTLKQVAGIDGGQIAVS